jgi:hypothetical protein
MSKDKQTDGGPAFPFQCQGPTTAPEFYYGMALRDYFAAKAMQGLIASPRTPLGTVNDVTDQLIAKLSYIMADAMLRARALEGE